MKRKIKSKKAQTRSTQTDNTDIMQRDDKVTKVSNSMLVTSKN